MKGLVTPLSGIMIDPTGERTIITFRDPELWKVTLPPADVLLQDCDAILTESRCAAFCTDLNCRSREYPFSDLDVGRPYGRTAGVSTFMPCARDIR